MSREAGMDVATVKGRRKAAGNGRRPGVASRIGNVLVRLFAGFNLMSLILLWAVCACQYVTPEWWTLTGVLCLVLPVMVLANVLFIPFWLVVRVKYVLMPLVGMALCAGSLLTYCPVMGGKADETRALRVVTYNTHGWGGKDAMQDGKNMVVQWLLSQDADIILVQEGTFTDDRVKPFVDAGYKLARGAGDKYGSGILTRLPVIDCDSLDMMFPKSNGAYAHLRYGEDTLAVFSVHLESYGLSMEDKDDYERVVRNRAGDSARAVSRSLVTRIRPVMAQHAAQADMLRSLAENELARGRHVVVGGDFNDVPNSYTASTMRAALTDSYREAGRGPGFTFNDRLMYFRIDHVFCSPSLRPQRARVDKSITYSDHYPLVSDFAR